jgi:malate/lactate dehydrogenase
LDIADQKAAGIALDMPRKCPIWGSDARVLAPATTPRVPESDIVDHVGRARKPGMSRDDL